jgi:soluble epoxide hydrolase/lipid-phosphate phosphatase
MALTCGSRVGVPFMPPDGSPFPVELLNQTFAPILGFEPLGYIDFFLKPEAPKIIQEHVSSLSDIFKKKERNLC